MFMAGKSIEASNNYLLTTPNVAAVHHLREVGDEGRAEKEEEKGGEEKLERKSLVMIPAFKATPTSIIRENTTRNAGSPTFINSSSTTDAGRSSPNPTHSHVPHEPYKGAVWSKPVRVSSTGNGDQKYGSHQASPRSSKPPSRGPSRAPSRNSVVGGGGNVSGGNRLGHHSVSTSDDITSPSPSTLSLLASSPKLALATIAKPVSVVNPVKSKGSQTSPENPNFTKALAASTTTSADPKDEFQGSTMEALRVEILRLREENRRLHAMRRTSGCDNSTRRILGEYSETPQESLQREKEALEEKVKTLTSQLQIQAQVNHDLKKLVIASIGDDLQYRFETISSSRAQLDQEASYLLRSLGDTKEELEKTSIECDVWKSKFMASRVMVDGLASWKAALQVKQVEMQGVLKLVVEENETLHSLAAATNRNLNQLSSCLRTRYPKLGSSKVMTEIALREGKSDKRNLLEVEKENRRVAQSLNFEIEALIKVAADRNLDNPSSPFISQTPSATAAGIMESGGCNPNCPEAVPNHFNSVSLTPAATLARQVLATEMTSPPKLSTDAIAYLDILFGQGQSPEFTFKCCENCNGDIKTL